MQKTKLFLLVNLMVILFVSTGFADTMNIDLNMFYFDMSVEIQNSGSSAVMSEDSQYGSVLLSNDPGMGDPGIDVVDDMLTLSFDYSVDVAENNTDSFYAKLFDGDTGDIISDFELLESGFGNITWDLSTLDPSISVLGLEFQLNSEDNFYDSIVNISNVKIEIASPSPVPEPCTLVLMGSGFLGMGMIRRKKKI